MYEFFNFAGLLAIVPVLGLMLPQTFAQSGENSNVGNSNAPLRAHQTTQGNPSNPQLDPTIGREFGSCVASGFNEANPNCP